MSLVFNFLVEEVALHGTVGCSEDDLVAAVASSAAQPVPDPILALPSYLLRRLTRHPHIRMQNVTCGQSLATERASLSGDKSPKGPTKNKKNMKVFVASSELQAQVFGVQPGSLVEGNKLMMELLAEVGMSRTKGVTFPILKKRYPAIAARADSTYAVKKPPALAFLVDRLVASGLMCKQYESLHAKPGNALLLGKKVVFLTRFQRVSTVDIHRWADSSLLEDATYGILRSASAAGISKLSVEDMQCLLGDFTRVRVPEESAEQSHTAVKAEPCGAATTSTTPSALSAAEPTSPRRDNTPLGRNTMFRRMLWTNFTSRSRIHATLADSSRAPGGSKQAFKIFSVEDSGLEYFALTPTTPPASERTTVQDAQSNLAHRKSSIKGGAFHELARQEALVRAVETAGEKGMSTMELCDLVGAFGFKRFPQECAHLQTQCQWVATKMQDGKVSYWRYFKKSEEIATKKHSTEGSEPVVDAGWEEPPNLLQESSVLDFRAVMQAERCCLFKSALQQLQKFRLARDQPRLVKKKFREIVEQELKDNRLCCEGTLLWLPSAASDPMVVDHLNTLQQQAEALQKKNMTKRRQHRSTPSKKRHKKHKARRAKPDADADSSDSADSYISDYDSVLGTPVVATPVASSSTGLVGVVATPFSPGHTSEKDRFGGLFSQTSTRNKTIPSAVDLTAFHVQFWKIFSSSSLPKSSQSSGPNLRAVTFMEALGELPLAFLLKHGPRWDSHDRELLLSCALDDGSQPAPRATSPEADFYDFRQRKFKTLPLSVRKELLGLSQADKKPVAWRFLHAVFQAFLMVGAVQPANCKPSTAHQRLGEMTGPRLKPHAVHDNKWLSDDCYFFTDCLELLLQGHLPEFSFPDATLIEHQIFVETFDLDSSNESVSLQRIATFWERLRQLLAQPMSAHPADSYLALHSSMAAAINNYFDSGSAPQHFDTLAGSFALSSNRAETVEGILSTPWRKVQMAGEIVDLLHLFLRHNIAQRADKRPSLNFLRFASRTGVVPSRQSNVSTSGPSCLDSTGCPSSQPSVPQIIPVLQLLQAKGIVKFDTITKQILVCGQRLVRLNSLTGEILAEECTEAFPLAARLPSQLTSTPQPPEQKPFTTPFAILLDEVDVRIAGKGVSALRLAREGVPDSSVIDSLTRKAKAARKTAELLASEFLAGNVEYQDIEVDRERKGPGILRSARKIYQIESPFATARKPSAFLQSRMGQNVRPAVTARGSDHPQQRCANSRSGVAAIKAALIEAGETGLSLRTIRQQLCADCSDVDTCVEGLLWEGFAGYRIPALLLPTLNATRKPNRAEAWIAPRLVALSTVRHFTPVATLLSWHTRQELLQRVEMSSSSLQQVGDAFAIAHQSKLTFEARLERAISKFVQSSAGLETADIAAAFSPVVGPARVEAAIARLQNLGKIELGLTSGGKLYVLWEPAPHQASGGGLAAQPSAASDLQTLKGICTGSVAVQLFRMDTSRTDEHEAACAGNYAQLCPSHFLHQQTKYL